METIVFLSGFSLPKCITKSSWFFEDAFWSNYHRIYYNSKAPTSDQMVINELDHLNQLINCYPEPLVVGHSLGAWWAANLACHTQSKIKKLALWTPLGIAETIPIFKITDKSEVLNKEPNLHNMGPGKTFVIYAKHDLIVPYRKHALPLINKFHGISMCLNGGHVWQSDHKIGLKVLKDWFEVG